MDTSLATPASSERGPSRNRRPRRAGQRGQSTVEYALLLLGAAAIAMLVVAWVAKTDMIGRLFEMVIGRIVDQA
ncbi:MAG TPA: DUF4244 domain-containing protein [Microthrixaceae bacterium]|nr:DUF4244 domain-containing protein [Microthrixaceae bacterium]